MRKDTEAKINAIKGRISKISESLDRYEGNTQTRSTLYHATVNLRDALERELEAVRDIAIFENYIDEL
jgi:hypothetical protein